MVTLFKIISDCPQCHEISAFGNLCVYENKLTQGCKSCSHVEVRDLPSLRKKIIYLDQLIESNIFKKKDKRFIKIIPLLSKLIQMQLIVCPYSDMHEIETCAWSNPEQKNLWKFIQNQARGHRFVDKESIKAKQISRAINAFTASKGLKQEVDLNEAFIDDINAWNNYVWLNTDKPIGDAKIIASLKEKTVEEFYRRIPVWKDNKNISFNEDFSLEIEAMGKELISACTRDAVEALFFSELNKKDHESCLSDLPILKAFRPFSENNHKTISSFIKSEYFANIPFMIIRAKLLAFLKEK